MNQIKRKKVLYLITKSNWGGAQRYVYDLASTLDRTLFEPVVALGGDGPLKERLYHAGIKTISIESLTRDVSLKNEWLFAKELWSILRAEKPDVFHVNSSKAGGVGTFVGRLVGIKRIIFTAHGWAFNEDRPKAQKILIGFFHYVTVLLSHKTIAVSKAVMEQMNWPFALKKMKLIYPGRTIGAMYNKQEAKEHILEYNKSLAAVTNQPWIVTIAELHPTKQINVLIEATDAAVSQNQKITTIIIGGGELEKQLQQLVSKKRLENNVYFTGPITEAARFLKAADLFVLPSRSEAYGYVIHEAALAKVPVIVSDVGGLKELVTDGVTGKTIPPGATLSLAASFKDYFEHKDKWQKFAEAAYESVKDRTVERMTRQTEALYTLALDK